VVLGAAWIVVGVVLGAIHRTHSSEFDMPMGFYAWVVLVGVTLVIGVLWSPVLAGFVFILSPLVPLTRAVQIWRRARAD
jgi:hypothetical protein